MLILKFPKYFLLSLLCFYNQPIIKELEGTELGVAAAAQAFK